MSFIITSGLGGNKFVTQGYGSGSSQAGGDSSAFYYGFGSGYRKKKKHADFELLKLLKRFLEKVNDEHK